MNRTSISVLNAFLFSQDTLYVWTVNRYPAAVLYRTVPVLVRILYLIVPYPRVWMEAFLGAKKHTN